MNLCQRYAVQPSASAVKAAQLWRVALVAGERDRSAAKLKRAARRLARAGVDARFFSLPATGHYFDRRSEERMVESLVLLRESLGVSQSPRAGPAARSAGDGANRPAFGATTVSRTGSVLRLDLVSANQAALLAKPVGAGGVAVASTF
jgi:acetyl esterase/lipase